MIRYPVAEFEYCTLDPNNHGQPKLAMINFAWGNDGTASFSRSLPYHANPASLEPGVSVLQRDCIGLVMVFTTRSETAGTALSFRAS
jgi:hypothetical protein